jgi:ribosome-interacting GTPase 1
MEKDYSQGKIYMIRPTVEHSKPSDIYIGSTTKPLKRRMSEHRSSYKKWKECKYKFNTVYNIFDKYGIENCNIVLIEDVNANCRQEIFAREQYYIKLLSCVNKCIPGRTVKEHYKDNKEKHLAMMKVYREANKEKIKQQQYKVCICEICAYTYTHHHKSRHQKSQYCQSFLTGC